MEGQLFTNRKKENGSQWGHALEGGTADGGCLPNAAYQSPLRVPMEPRGHCSAHLRAHHQLRHTVHHGNSRCRKGYLLLSIFTLQPVSVESIGLTVCGKEHLTVNVVV